MNRWKIAPAILLFVEFYFLKLADIILHPLKGIPMPDFNNQYDEKMLS